MTDEKDHFSIFWVPLFYGTLLDETIRIPVETTTPCRASRLVPVSHSSLSDELRDSVRHGFNVAYGKGDTSMVSSILPTRKKPL
jgi:hypothetical protein